MKSLRPAICPILLALVILGASIGPTHAQDPEDELGTWFIWNGTIRFDDRWSIFTEAQVRLWELTSNVEDIFGRVAGQYNLNPNALVAVGYLRSTVWLFQDDSIDRHEHRLYEQLTLVQPWGRTRVEHRYRLEQRWFDDNPGNRYSNRVRYRLQFTSPLNRTSLEGGAVFLNFFNEFFIGFDEARFFDQNRLYGALGYQFNRLSNLQIGMLWIARTDADFFRLQIFYTHNFDV